MTRTISLINSALRTPPGASCLPIDPSLGGVAENLVVSAPETGVLAIEGAATILTARLTVTVDYLVSDPLAG